MTMWVCFVMLVSLSLAFTLHFTLFAVVAINRTAISCSINGKFDTLDCDVAG